jgi:serine protease Do
MKRYSILLAALAVCLGGPAFAQSKQKIKPVRKTIQKQEETIVIKKDDNSPQTIVEIKKGGVYINGEKVAESNTGPNVHKKIIIDNSVDAPLPPDVPDANVYGDMPASERKAMLGVYTGKAEDVNGAEIQRIMPNSGADKAGLKEGDVITKINGRDVADPKELTEVIANHISGDKVTVTYERNGKTRETEATLTEGMHENTARNFHRYDMRDMPNPMRPFWYDANDNPFASTPKLGIEAEELADGDGVRVAGIKPGSPAQKAGIEKGDIITKIDNERISSVDDIREALHNSTDQTVKLHYRRNGEKATTEVYLPRQKRKEDL